MAARERLCSFASSAEFFPASNAAARRSSSPEVHRTNVACRLLDLTTARCADYRHRKALVPDCLRLTPRLAASAAWLPTTCAYRLRAEGEPLPVEIKTGISDGVVTEVVEG